LDAPDASTLASLEQGHSRIELNAFDTVAQTVLQHADAIDDRVDPLQESLPCGGIGQLRKVGCDPSCIGKAPPRLID
jgi:hypothetical protein